MYPAFQVCHGALDTCRPGCRVAVDRARTTANKTNTLAAISRRECRRNLDMYV
jgi:hypothetical protein